MNIEIEQLMELEEGKTYYIRLPEGTSAESMQNFGEDVAALDLKIIFLVGMGEFDIKDVTDQMEKL